MKKLFILLLVVAFLASMLMLGVGCKEEVIAPAEEEEAVEEVEEEAPAEEEVKEEKVTLVFTNHMAAEEQAAKVIDEMIRRFEEKHPNIEIVNEAIPWSQLRNQVLIKATAGNAPDVSLQGEHELSALAEAGVLASLDDYFTEEELADFFQGDLEGCRFTYVDADGNESKELTAVPWAPMSITFNWNKNLFKAAGLNPDVPPKTWDEMTEMARKISALGTDEEGNKIYGLAFRTDTSSGVGYWFLNTLWAFGGDFFDEEGNVVVNSEGAVEALNWYKMLADEGLMPVGIGIRDIRVMFSQNQVGMRWGCPAMIGIGRMQSGLDEEWDNQWGVAPMPVNKNTEPVCFTSTHTLIMTRQCEHKEEAMEFIKFLTMDKDITEYYYKETGMLPPLMSLAESDVYEEPLIQPFLEALYTARAQPASNPNYTKACDFMRIAIQRVLIEGVDAKVALDEAAASIKVLYGQ